MEKFQIAPETRIGFIALKVADLQSMTDFYTKIIGFDILKQSQDTIYLGIRINQQVLLTLRQVPGSINRQPTTGLEHFAILLPHTKQLGAALEHVRNNNIKLIGVYENGYSQTFAVEDPEGNGVEIAVDKSEEAWGTMNKYDWENEVTKKITPQVILNEKTGHFTHLPSGTTIGHVQLRVKDLAQTADFYTQALGFNMKKVGDDNQRFLSAGDYHHHIGINLAPEDTSNLKQATSHDLGLDFVNVVLPTVNDMDILASNLSEQKISDYDYSSSSHYLMLEDPNHIRLWFSVA